VLRELHDFRVDVHLQGIAKVLLLFYEVLVLGKLHDLRIYVHLVLQ
jgi:hypothetical protein